MKKPIKYIQNLFNSRRLEMIDSDEITLQYIYDNILNKLLQNRKEELKEFQIENPSDEKIEIYLHLNDKMSENQIKKKIFQIELNNVDNKKQILLTNQSDAQLETNSHVHVNYVRSINEKENMDSLYNYFLQNFEKMIELFSQKGQTLQDFMQGYLYKFLDVQGYQIERRVRSFKSDYETSEILDISDKENGIKYFEIFIYNVDTFFIGLQINTNNKVSEIKIPKNNLEVGFEKIKPQLELFCPSISGQSEEQLEQLFGLTYQKKREIIIQQVQNVCKEFQLSDQSLVDYPASAFLLNLSSFQCSLGKSKIMVEEITNSFLQYIYIIFDNEYFRSGYVVSPLIDNFQNTVNKILNESLDEIQQVTELKENKNENFEKPTFELIKQDLINAGSNSNIQLDCGDEQDNSILCNQNGNVVLTIAKVQINETDYFRIQFLKKPQQNQKSGKIMNDIKIPIDNDFNLHKRLTPIAQDFFEHYNTKIQFNLYKLISQIIQQF